MSRNCNCNLVWMLFLNFFFQNYVFAHFHGVFAPFPGAGGLLCAAWATSSMKKHRNPSCRSCSIKRFPRTSWEVFVFAWSVFPLFYRDFWLAHFDMRCLNQGLQITCFLYSEIHTSDLSNKSMTSPYLSSCSEWRIFGVSCCVVAKYF